jgi:DNA-binding IclR family transcriptional regulator
MYQTDYTNLAQQRLLKIVIALFSDVVFGLSPSALAREVHCAQSVITRDLDNLRTAGLAEKDESTGYWRLTPRLPQQAIKALNSIDRASRKVEETKNRYTRNPD